MHCKIAHSPEDAQRAVIELTVVNSRLGRAPRLPAGHHHGCVAGAVWWHVRSRTQETRHDCIVRFQQRLCDLKYMKYTFPSRVYIHL